MYQALKGECLSSLFSPDGTLISASAAPHCGEEREERGDGGGGGGDDGDDDDDNGGRLVSWYFEPSPPQMIISGLKTNFSLSLSYSLNKL